MFEFMFLFIVLMIVFFGGYGYATYKLNRSFEERLDVETVEAHNDGVRMGTSRALESVDDSFRNGYDEGFEQGVDEYKPKKGYITVLRKDVKKAQLKRYDS